MPAFVLKEKDYQLHHAISALGENNLTDEVENGTVFTADKLEPAKPPEKDLS
jgi:hypothetical protein